MTPLSTPLGGAISGGMTNPNDPVGWHGTTILCVRRDGKVAMAGDGQVSLGNTVVKGNARKVRRIGNGVVIACLLYTSMGHALVAMALPDVDKVQKISIIPHGIAALGYKMCIRDRHGAKR